MAEYKIVHYDYYGDSVGDVKPNGIDFTDALNGIPSITYNVPIESALAKSGNVDPDRHDWKLFVNNIAVAGGFISSVEYNSDNRYLVVTGQGYLGYLAKRIMKFDPSSDLNQQNYTRNNADVLDIVRGWLSFVLHTPNSIPITFDSTDSGFITSLFFDCSTRTDLLSQLQTVASAQPGFDYYIDENCFMTFYTPQKGQYSSLVLELHTNISNMDNIDNGIKGTNVSATATGAGNSQVARWVSSSPNGRIVDDVVDYGQAKSLDQITGLANKELELALKKQDDLTVSAKPGPYDNLWAAAQVGDYIKVRADLEYRKINDWYRCTQIEVTPTDQGDELFIYTFGQSTTG